MKSPLLTVAILLLAVSCRGSLACWRRQRDQSSSPASGGDGPIRVSGRVQLNPPAVLPANTRLVVELRDTSLADAPSKLLGKRTIDNAEAAYNSDGSIPFTVEGTVPTGTPFLPGSISVSASLRGEGVSYITDTMFNVNLESGTSTYGGMVITIIKYPAA